MNNLNPVDTRMRSDDILLTKLIGIVDEPMIKATRESVLMHFGRSSPTDWIIDATGVEKIKPEATSMITELLVDLRRQNGRHIFLVSGDNMIRMVAGTVGWASGAKLAVVTTLHEALEEIVRRIKEG